MQAAFAIELFIVFFSAICCFFYSPTEKAQTGRTETEMVFHESETSATETAENIELVETSIKPEITFVSDNKIDTDATDIKAENQPDSLEEIVSALTLTQARKVCSLLREKSIIAREVKLSGKGIGKEFLIGFIKDKLLEQRETIAAVLSQILGQVIE